MFGELKKRLANAVKSFVRSEEKRAEETVEAPKPEPVQPVEIKQDIAEPIPEVREEPKMTVEEHKVEHRPEPRVEHHKEEVKPVEQPRPQPRQPEPQRQEQRHVEPPRVEEKREIHKPVHEPPKPAPKIEAHEAKQEKPQKEEPMVKLSFTTKLKSVFLGSIALNDSDIERFTDNVKISMLESDVSFDTTEAFIDDLTNNLRGKKVDSKHIEEEVTKFVRESLFNILKPAGNGVDMRQFISARKREGTTPVKILFLGPNGTGKTTTIAKITNLLKNEGVSVVLSASDTFRAAAIEQLEHHAQKIGVPVIKSSYGADPASIAFDAIAYAKAHKADAVLIDSAGRQETNKNLIMEVQKMVRVAQPDLIVYVGESTSGNAISEQIKEFSKFLKINGIVLTKLDCDAKGGGAISISHVTGIPILFFGTGEKYDALVPYSAEYIVNSILPNN
ncbi:MAG: signal recognition particle-docking protein FtsY [Candidatus Micrarchaeota archaeon]|nr:signal recognition particle-docking protein FtsY [Candidatus Micrarchaeota archaeon]